MKLRIIDSCPVPASIAPYVYLVLRDAGHTASSIYRGEDAKALLHRHGKKTQGEVFATSPPGVANPAGRSMHELRSDGSAKAGPVGRRLQEWEIGVDSGANTQHARYQIEHAATARGWQVYHPYSTGVELHHWGFKRKPRARGPVQLARLIRIRRRLPRS